MQPGWYPDPNEPPNAARFERWWNGSAWTDHTRPTALGQPAKVSNQRAVAIVVVLGFVVLLAYLIATGW